MKKTNVQIELECAQNWLQVYREKGITGRRVTAMRAHVRELRRKINGKVSA